MENAQVGAVLAPDHAIPNRKHAQKIALATIVGTTIEWYDYFIYAAVAGLVFNQVFFKPAGPVFATLLVFASV